jgi:hypothetical protein
MLRTVAAVLVGLVVMLAVVAGVELLGHALFPPPPGLDVSTPDGLRAALGKLPFAALAFVVLAWTLGAFLGALATAWIMREHRGAGALAIGVVMLLLVALTLTAFPHPWWMVVAGLVLPLPAAWLAGRLLRRAAPQLNAPPASSTRNAT